MKTFAGIITLALVSTLTSCPFPMPEYEYYLLKENRELEFSYVRHADFLDDGTVFLFGGRDNGYGRKLYRWTVADGLEELFDYETVYVYGEEPSAMVACDTGIFLPFDKQLNFFSLQGGTNELVHQFDDYISGVYLLKSHLLVIIKDGSYSDVYLFPLTGETHIDSLRRHRRHTDGVYASGLGRMYLIDPYYDRLWYLDIDEELGEITGDGEFSLDFIYEPLVMSENERYLASGAYVYDISSGDPENRQRSYYSPHIITDEFAVHFDWDGNVRGIRDFPTYSDYQENWEDLFVLKGDFKNAAYVNGAVQVVTWDGGQWELYLYKIPENNILSKLPGTDEYYDSFW